jgi:hypothetical protein
VVVGVAMGWLGVNAPQADNPVRIIITSKPSLIIMAILLL